jgi:hypothetical protein
VYAVCGCVCGAWLCGAWLCVPCVADFKALYDQERLEGEDHREAANYLAMDVYLLKEALAKVAPPTAMPRLSDFADVKSGIWDKIGIARKGDALLSSGGRLCKSELCVALSRSGVRVPGSLCLTVFEGMDVRGGALLCVRWWRVFYSQAPPLQALQGWTPLQVRRPCPQARPDT